MKSLEVNKFLAIYLLVITSVVFAFYFVVDHHETGQKKIASHISHHLIPDIKLTIHIRDELVDIKKSLHQMRAVQGDAEASQLELAHIRSSDQHVLKEFADYHQQLKLHDELADLDKLEEAYREFHSNLTSFLDGYLKSGTLHTLIRYEVAVKEVLRINESLIESYQAHIHKAAKNLTDQSVLSNKFLIGTMFFLSLVVGLGYHLYGQVVRMLGAKPKLFVSDLSRLLKGQLLDKSHARDTLIGQVDHILTTDELTKLPNKLGLKVWLQHQQSITKASCFLLHIDGLNLLRNHFKSSTYQEEIQLLTGSLISLLGDKSCLARVDSETFVIINTTLDDQSEINSYAELLLNSIRHSSLLHTRLSMLKVSIGVVHETLRPLESDLLLQHAALALSKSRQNDGNNYVLFEPDLLEQEKQRLELLGDLGKALQRGEFSLAFQPQVDFQSGQIVGAEALIRWRHPHKGMVSPAVFIPIAEESGFINEIGDWVLEQAISAAVSINTQSESLIPISINVSSHQFLSKGFVLKVEGLLAQKLCNPAWIKLEITEGVMLDNSSELRGTMMDIAEKGISICLDDFGTGYSSLSYLTQYPISQIKIDRGFMADIAIRLDSQALVQTIVRISEIFQFEIVAEGVESVDQLDFLKKTSCRIVQGFFYYKPMPYEALLEVLGNSTKLANTVNGIESNNKESV